MLLSTNVCEERRCGKCEHTGEEITRPAVTTSGGGRVRTVGADHVVNGCHVDAVIGDSYNGSEDAGSNPGNRWTSGSPCEPNETEREARCCVEKPPEAGLVLSFLIVRVCLTVFYVPLDGWDKQSVGDEVADQDRNEGKALRDNSEIVLRVDEGERLNEHEDKGVAESGEEGEDENDGFGKEHLEGTDPGNEDLLERESLLEGCDFVGSVDVGVGAILASLLGDPIHHDSSPSLWNKNKMSELNSAAEDQLVRG